MNIAIERHRLDDTSTSLWINFFLENGANVEGLKGIIMYNCTVQFSLLFLVLIMCTIVLLVFFGEVQYFSYHTVHFF